MRRRIVAGAALAVIGLGIAHVYSAQLGFPPARAHGEASLLFAPWVAENDALTRIHRAGGVAIAEPGGSAGNIGVFRAIAAGADFAARVRSEGALLVMFN